MAITDESINELNKVLKANIDSESTALKYWVTYAIEKSKNGNPKVDSIIDFNNKYYPEWVTDTIGQAAYCDLNLILIDVKEIELDYVIETFYNSISTMVATVAENVSQNGNTDIANIRDMLRNTLRDMRKGVREYIELQNEGDSVQNEIDELEKEAKDAVNETINDINNPEEETMKNDNQTNETNDTTETNDATTKSSWWKKGLIIGGVVAAVSVGAYYVLNRD